MKRIFLALVLIGAITAMAAPPCWACSCAPLTKKEKAKAADVIFYGEVTAIAGTQEPGEVVKVTFDVIRVYKGYPKATTSVFAATDDAMCGVSFEVGEKYTVFSYKDKDGKKWTTSCSGTKQGRIKPSLYGLPKGHPPQDS